MAREQWLHADASATAASTPQPFTVRTTRVGDPGRLAIVGDSAGVSVVQHARAKPELSGGFGRRN